jgi:hypothetical protein
MHDLTHTKATARDSFIAMIAHLSLPGEDGFVLKDEDAGDSLCGLIALARRIRSEKQSAPVTTTPAERLESSASPRQPRAGVGIQMAGAGSIPDAGNPQPTTQEKLEAVDQAIADYHCALSRREHGGFAQDQAIKKIERILGRYWNA